ncbi:sigma 54-interacting transcriptional regulator [Phytobacter diazotrophicus]|uniref:sigma 54-interacting transcriptional regulator n=1 Tax=Phytobacter diazotrophicus TaxID=395631 RepID=UPI002935BCA9|nr:sigma 54-interacting transcriptional regulator [Phytobacter diazotrophicus]MDV2902064.1 sigma 54-interacting transcriptional regulator [Phytobacter diazotrophicus]
MKNNEIAIFSVSKTITQRISNVLIERKIDIPVYEFHYFDVVEKAQQLVAGGTKIIISRGGTAALLRNSLSIPVIEITHELHGIYRILQEARKKSQKIAAVGFPQFCNVLRRYQNMTNEDFKICQVYNHYDIENVVKNLADNDYQLVIGGLTVAEMAKKYDLNVIMGDTDNISIEQALDVAESLLKYINNENMKLTMSWSALNQSHEGIMCLDQSGEIIHINARGFALFQCNIGDKIFKKEAFKSIYGSIINEIDIKEHAIEIDGETVNIAVKHFSNKHGFYTVITGSRLEHNGWSSSRTSKKSDHKGFTTTYSFADIIGQSPVMEAAIARAKIYAAHDLPINILGDTGTGKELFAQSIHHASPRSAEPFIAINCAAIPESLLESELFGYADGAFTNARRGGKPGIFEMAMNGTVFIDEISEAPLPVQIKLLRILQEKRFSRVGGDSLISARFRLITASNKELGAQVAAGEFRQDLWYRINVLTLQLPALRERTGDVMLIIEDLLAKHNKALSFTDEAVDFLNSYAWPGNIRELQAVILRLIVLFDMHVVDVDALQSLCHMSVSVDDEDIVPQPGDVDLLKKQEQKLIGAVMKRTGGDKSQAAVMLGISPTTLWRKMKEYGVEGV